MSDEPAAPPRRATGRAAWQRAGLADPWDFVHRPPRLARDPAAIPTAWPPPRGERVQLLARIVSHRVTPGFRGRRATLVVRADYQGHPLTLRFFNAAWMRDHLLPGESYWLEGRTDARDGSVLIQPRCTRVEVGGGPRQGIERSYAIPAGIGTGTYQQHLAAALDDIVPQLRDPAGLLDDATYRQAIDDLHRSSTADAYAAARAVLAQRELLALSWILRQRRPADGTGRSWRLEAATMARAQARLPFALTAGQAVVWGEIMADLRRARPMRRLLHGEVGGGKTAVAFLAALAVVADGAQVVVLAPTALLARQHHATMAGWLRDSRVVPGLLTGANSAGERRLLLADLAAGRCRLLVATHAVLEDSVQFADLGLVIIDEQHKFGVAQRAALLARAAVPPDLLMLTATPIPRSLAMTCWGDLDLSLLRGRPSGRGGVNTRVTPWSVGALVEELRRCVAGGGAAYVVTPRREQGSAEATDAAGLMNELLRLAPELRLAAATGADDEEVLAERVAALAVGSLDALVGTTVVEVGVDVPRATLMAVVDAPRFGLAQLHQLRGRIGRGAAAGICLLYHRKPVEGTRLQLLAEQDDGLAIAEADLAERGPGELLGTRQAGLPGLRCADPVSDAPLLSAALPALAAWDRAGGPPDARLLRLVDASDCKAAPDTAS
jgi:ATP-dependent DNA helicase RecG